jgi:hypothetical protein
MAIVPAVQAASTIYVTTIASDINGDADCSLPEAIYAANLDASKAPDASSPGSFFTTGCTAGDGSDKIVLLPAFGVYQYTDPIDDPDNFIGPSVTPIVTSTILIDGLGVRMERISAGRPTRAFVVGPTGNLTLREVHIKGFSIHGGNGNDGGGGGMGAGGAVYVQGGSLTVDRSTFEGNTAEGGNGSFQDTIAGGGGGGLSGNGGSANSIEGAGGGGSRGNGGNGVNEGGGGGGRVTSGFREIPGEPCGGAGGVQGLFGSVAGHDAECAGGGGGGATERIPFFDPICGEDGGTGSYGGGGGGGGDAGNGGHGGFGGGGGGGGGDAGFGGGGGSVENCAFFPSDGQGGTFAGDGGGHGGGGGAGLGGAIFGYLASIDIVNSTFTTNGAYRGRSGGDEANDGRGAGGAIFTVAGSLTIESSTIAGNETREWTDTASGPVGIGGGGIVVYDPEGTDEATLLLHNSIVAGNGPFECYTRNGVTTSGSAGNLITNSTDNVRGDPHCPGVVASTDPGLQALALNIPGRTMTMKIPTTSAAVDAAVGTSPQIDQRLILRPQGAKSDIGAYEAATIPPVTAITLDPAAPDGSNGWYRQTVGVAIVASDVDGTVAQTRCALDPAVAPGGFADLVDAACTVSTVGADGPHTLYAGSIDADGNIESPLATAAFKIDQTPPTLSPTLSATTVVVGQTGVTASPNPSDMTSGVASSSCGTIDTSSPGVHTVTCTATDNAGNSASADLAYVVEYRILGFFAPVPDSRWMVGQNVPIKIALGDASDTRISDAEGVALASACRVRFSASGAQTKAPQCMKYDTEEHQFVYNWKLAKKGIGSATIMVSISYPDTTSTTQKTEQITITR